MSKAQEIMRLRKATGMGVVESRKFLDDKSPDLVARIIKAHGTQSEQTLHDPIEDDPEFVDAIAETDREVDGLLKNEAERLGLCHLHLMHKKRILKERFGITSYSPADMNPGCCFD